MPHWTTEPDPFPTLHWCPTESRLPSPEVPAAGTAYRHDSIEPRYARRAMSRQAPNYDRKLTRRIVLAVIGQRAQVFLE